MSSHTTIDSRAMRQKGEEATCNPTPISYLPNYHKLEDTTLLLAAPPSNRQQPLTHYPVTNASCRAAPTLPAVPPHASEDHSPQDTNPPSVSNLTAALQPFLGGLNASSARPTP
ncbi:hypothetical protein MLD38_010633 [Melastoma candidum]|uniref:Uncharacterized protein n=2 Tax=Melastoma candidum TaxID=119954 RepID=A0ACB9R3Z9_9MYRT|nr:hypothetical protein MLD38_010632 [Melastoma candidum]KAI4372395.1 hypothetical protein MLD38_010633 [Melastoma candidum]